MGTINRIGVGVGFRQGAHVNQIPTYLKDGNTFLFWDFENANSITKDGDNKISIWKDVLGSGHDGLQTETKRQPRLTDEGVLFDSIDDFIKTIPAALIRPTYVYALIKQNLWKVNTRIFDGNADNSMGLLYSNPSPSISMQASVVGSANVDNLIGEFVVIRTLAATQSGGLSPASYIQVNDLTKHTGNTGTVNAGGFTLGDIGSSHGVSAQSNITVKKVIVRSAALSIEDELSLYNDFTSKKTKSLNKYDYTLILGNSITVYPGPSPIWWGNWGMAATVKDNDYVHKLQAKLRTINPKTVVYPTYNLAWESAHATYDLTLFDKYLLLNPKRVILKIGENVSTTTVDNGTFATSLQTLINYIKSKAPLAQIVIGGVFIPSATKDAVLSSAATFNNLLFIPNSDLYTPENKSYIGAIVYDELGVSHTVNDAGVALHPNDLGMEALAERIFQGLIT